jgi:hypothetical protein
MSGDFVDEMVAKRAARDPEFPRKVVDARKKLDTSYHDRRRAERIAQDPEFAAEYERQRRYLGQSGRTESE